MLCSFCAAGVGTAQQISGVKFAFANSGIAIPHSLSSVGGGEVICGVRFWGGGCVLKNVKKRVSFDPTRSYILAQSKYKAHEVQKCNKWFRRCKPGRNARENISASCSGVKGCGRGGSFDLSCGRGVCVWGGGGSSKISGKTLSNGTDIRCDGVWAGYALLEVQ